MEWTMAKKQLNKKRKTILVTGATGHQGGAVACVLP
jgi:FlaA1/EpsC-like NDP-sugar epimerase